MSPASCWSRCRAAGCSRRGRPVVVLCSGGRDSTCLLDLACGSPARAVSALHVNYGLRDGADADERHCAELCAALGVRARRVDAPAAGRSAGNLQAWARDGAMARRRGSPSPRGADVAAGHTATDQVETILYRLASSPSRRALLGMAPRDGLLIRPLLGFTREETGGVLPRARPGVARGRDQRARRVRARTDARAARPGAASDPSRPRANVLALAEMLRDEAAVLDELVDEVLGGRAGSSSARLRALPAALARLVVQRLADGAAGGPRRARRAAPRSCSRSRPRHGASTSARRRAVVEYGVLRIERGRRAAGPPRCAAGARRVASALTSPLRASGRRAARPGVLDREPWLASCSCAPGARAIAWRRSAWAARKSLPGPVHRPARAARRRGAIAVVESRRRDRLGRRRGHLGALQGHRRDARGGAA